ncbi:MAG: ribosome biogenesis GTPase YlqF [Merismopedia sp. SIO2A8]|nr:ribosome biogenesis GTPase YlqF [Merismopedia sp. SIO2A8]
MSTPAIQWYPGHIAKAERQLQEQLKRVDVVLEVRDARIPLATHHPNVPKWIGDKARILVLNRVDMISADARQQWQDWFKDQGDRPYFVNAKQGKGVGQLAQAAKAAGKAMNDRRIKRGMRPRPVRVAVIGFPNVGKSALINRLLKKKVVASARRPGVTRQLRWVRISEELDLLDSPGVLPSKLTDQDAALKLAICDDIGQAGYDNQRVASAFIDLLKTLPNWADISSGEEVINDDVVFDTASASDGESQPGQSTPTDTLSVNTLVAKLAQRYHLNPTDSTGEGYLYDLAHHHYNGDQERMARQVLNDFRTGNLGAVILELPSLS